MGKVNVVFVILHYIVDKDTAECVESIRANLQADTYKIIIVDNASPNHSGETLKNKYVNAEDVIVIKNKENLGFARGNNVGFRYAKATYDPKFIVMLNNDTTLLHDDFYRKVNEEYESSHFAVLGPMIMTADGKCDCTPVSETPLTRDVILAQLRKEERRTAYINKGWPNPLTIIRKVDAALKKEPEVVHKDYLHRQENIRFHGCFMVFSKEFIDSFDGLNENTFLYHEEEILFVQLMGERLKIVYLPSIQIFHKEDAATNAIGRKKRDAKKFAYNCSLESCRELLKVYDKYNS